MRTGIDFALVEQVINARPSNIKLEDKKNWIKLEAPNGNRIYVAKQKKVRQIDLSGFGRNMYGTIPLYKPNGAVEAHLDLAHPDALKNLATFLETMAEITPTEKKRVAPTVSSSPKPTTPPASSPKEPTAEETAARLALIRKVAAEKGVSVSPDVESAS